MTSNFNKKKFNFLPSRQVIKYLIIIVLFFLIFIFIYNELRNKDRFYDFIQTFSEKFNYQLLNYEINSLNRVDKNEVMKIINKYLNQSIFLIPLNDISNSLHDLNWVKSVNLSTNLKNKIKVEIFEYKPIGLFFYNNQFFYFSREGKIIDKYIENINENFIIFYGTQVLKEANDFIISLDKVEGGHLISIKEAYYINERRWNIKLHNDILINLSEKNIEESINNYIRLIEKFNNSEIGSIKNIDLRNNEKAIISFK
jgi:cell division septal protein FtsQ